MSKKLRFRGPKNQFHFLGSMRSTRLNFRHFFPFGNLRKSAKSAVESLCPSFLCGLSVRALHWETAIKFLVAANPDPNPSLAVAERDRPAILGDANRPRAGIAPQSIQAQAGVPGVFQKPPISPPRGGLQLRRQSTVALPKARGRAGDHWADAKS